MAGAFHVESEMSTCRGWMGVLSPLLFPAFKAVTSVLSEWVLGRRGKNQGDQGQVGLGSKLQGFACRVLLNCPVYQPMA